MFLDEDRQDGDAAVDDSPMSEADASSFPYDSSVGDAARAGAGRPAVEATSSDDGSVADVPAVDAVSVPKDTKPIDVSDDGDDASGDGDAPGMGIDGCAAAVATKLTAKQKREMRKAKKADKVVAAASSTVVESSDGPALDALECSVCHDEFPSRNKRKPLWCAILAVVHRHAMPHAVMQHIKKSGHAVPLRSAPEVPVGKAGKGKRR